MPIDIKIDLDMETAQTRHTKMTCGSVHDLMPAVPCISVTM